MSTNLRIVTWNVGWRVGAKAEQQGKFLASLEPDIVCFQEVNSRSFAVLAAAAGLDRTLCSLDLTGSVGATRARSFGCAVASRGIALVPGQPPADLPLPERLQTCSVQLDAGQVLTVASYHAPPGVTWKERKPRQAVIVAHWLAGLHGPIIFCADANTPEIDHPDFQQTRTHWHTGMRRLKGEPGDDLLFGPDKKHGLDDALRRQLADHPVKLDQIRAQYPGGPLAVSHYTGKRKGHAGEPRRFDSIWVSEDIEVKTIEYLYDRSCEAGSDHAAAYADVTIAGLIHAR